MQRVHGTGTLALAAVGAAVGAVALDGAAVAEVRAVSREEPAVEVLAEVQTLNQLGERLRSMIKDNPR